MPEGDGSLEYALWLRRLQLRLPELGDDGNRMAKGIAKLLDPESRIRTLDAAIGMRQSYRWPRYALALERRDQKLRAFAHRQFPQLRGHALAKAASATASAYYRHGWPREKATGCPPSALGTPMQLLYEAALFGALPMTGKHWDRIIMAAPEAVPFGPVTAPLSGLTVRTPDEEVAERGRA